uniref:Repressor of RNA polymerase III transcription n=1 Tax=Saccharum officinarum TaxID=4547 RepID=A0A678TL22_SACOF|nr:Repressor of RNA polymerase III transcription [Saccharum officinarum]
MKFLEYTPFDSINLFLEQLNLGDCTIRGNLEAFSCKHTATDRRLSISLEHEILDYLGKSADSDPSSPVEHLSSRSSAVWAHLFFQEEELESFKQMVDTYLSDASRVIKIRECDIYSYNPDSDADPVLEKGAIKLSGDDFLTGVVSDGEEEDALIDMDI